MEKEADSGMLVEVWRKQQRERRRGLWLPKGRTPSSSSSSSSSLSTVTTRADSSSPSLPKGRRTRSSSSSPAQQQQQQQQQQEQQREEERKASRAVAYATSREVREKQKAALSSNEAGLEGAYRACASVLPAEDAEALEVVRLAKAYYDYWKPDDVRLILLAESHVYTTVEDSRVTFEVADYEGPTNFVALVYCLGYGEAGAMKGPTSNKNKGTPQFWEMLAAAARLDDRSSVLKKGTKALEERLQTKLRVLRQLKAEGVWLLDACVVGWYIPQDQAFRQSAVSGDVHRLGKARPPKSCKKPALALSWELFMKDVVKDATPKALVPVGMEVFHAIGRDNLQAALPEGATLYEPLPAPNAWIQGGYGPYFDQLATICKDVLSSS